MAGESMKEPGWGSPSARKLSIAIMEGSRRTAFRGRDRPLWWSFRFTRPHKLIGKLKNYILPDLSFKKLDWQFFLYIPLIANGSSDPGPYNIYSRGKTNLIG
jgi:hypothetical protein